MHNKRQQGSKMMNKKNDKETRAKKLTAPAVHSEDLSSNVSSSAAVWYTVMSFTGAVFIGFSTGRQQQLVCTTREGIRRVC